MKNLSFWITTMKNSFRSFSGRFITEILFGQRITIISPQQFLKNYEHYSRSFLSFDDNSTGIVWL